MGQGCTRVCSGDHEAELPADGLPLTKINLAPAHLHGSDIPYPCANEHGGIPASAVRATRSLERKIANTEI